MARTRTLDQQLPTVDPAEDLRTLSEGLADDDPGVREECAQRLAALRDPEAGPFLRHALDDDEDQVRVWGAYGLGLLARPEDRDELRRAARDDPSPLVRLWGTFGCALSGDDAAARALLEMLDLPDLELRANAADALLTLQDPSVIRPLLERRLALPDERRRVWAAAILHRLGHREAFGLWREGLVSPTARVHAAMAAPHLRSRRAARELVRVCAELSPEELDEPVPAAHDLPLAELLTSPLLDLGLRDLLEDARADLGLRADLLLLVLRGPAADPEVMAQIFEFASALEPAALGADLAELLSEQDPADRPRLLARTVDFAPGAVVPALERLDGGDRDAVFDQLADAAGAPDVENAMLAPLLALLRETPWAEQFADLPDAPWEAFEAAEAEEFPDEQDEELQAELEALGSEDDLSPVIERMAAGEQVSAEERASAEALLADLQLTPEEFVASLYADSDDLQDALPPEPQDVARRALCLGALAERARVERSLAEGQLRPAEAKKAARGLESWTDTEGLRLEMTAMELDLIDAEPGDWLDEDVALGEVASEAVAMLLWSTGKGPMPPTDRPADPKKTLGALPLQAPTAAWLESTTGVEPEALEGAREVYETLLWRAEQEDVARRLLAGEDVEAELDVQAVLEDLASDGFDVRAAQARGEAYLTAQALRFLGQRAVQGLPKSPQLVLAGGDLAWGGRGLTEVDDSALRTVLAVVSERHRALAWIGAGGEWDGPPPGEEAG
jgi:hypothetical protein